MGRDGREGGEGLETTAGWLVLTLSVFMPETGRLEDKREAGKVKL